MAEHTVVLDLYYAGGWHPAPVLNSGGCRLMRGVKTRGDSDPAGAAATIDNTSELYSPRSVASGLHGLIGQNTLARISADSSARIVGEVASWVPNRPIKGSGWTDIQIAGVLQRIGRGKDPLASPAQRSILPLSPLAYYPLTDGNKATSAADLTGGTALAVQGAPALASVPGPGAGDTSHPELLAAGAYVGGFTGPVPASTTGEWTYECWFRAVASAASCTGVIASFHASGTYGAMFWVLHFSKTAGTHHVFLAAQHDLSTATGFFANGGSLIDGAWHQVRVKATQVTGTQIHVEFWVDDVLRDQTTASTWTVGNLTTQKIGDYAGEVASLYPTTGVDSLSVAHVVPWSSDAPASTYDAGRGYAGELAANRFLRVGAEEGIASTVVGDPAESVAMGPQRRVTLLELYDELARTDDASIFETRDSVGLTMRTGASKLNQTAAATVSYLGQVQPPLAPVHGDAGIRNDVTASAPNGSSRRVQQSTGPHNVQLPADDPQGVGRYATRIDVNPATDDALSDAAGWRVNLGTFNGTAYAEITVDLDAAPELTATVAAVDIGDVVALTSLPVDEALEVVECLVIGIGEDLPPKRRLITFYCVPAEPYRVGVLAETTGDTGPVVGRLESDGTTTSAATAAGAALIPVATPTGPAWTTDPDDYPMDLIVGGQRISVSDCGPRDTFDRTVASGYGSEPVTGVTYAASGGAASDHAVGAGVATQTNTSVNVRRSALLDVGATSQDFYIDVMVTQASASGAAITQWAVARAANAGDCYVARLDVGTSGAVTLTLLKLNGGTQTTLASAVTLQAAHAASAWWRIRLQVIGSAIQAYAWATATMSEPTGFQLTVADTDHTTGTSIGFMSRLTTGNTNGTVVFSFDNLAVNMPQTFKVDPAGLQVAYPIAAGAQVNVQQPVIPTL